MICVCRVLGRSSAGGGLGFAFAFAFAAEVFATVGHECFHVFASFIVVRSLWGFSIVDFLAVCLFAEFKFVVFLHEIELALAGGFALVGDLQAGLFAEVREFVT